jgi:hypothetical protein
MQSNLSCKQRIESEYRSRIDDFARLWEKYRDDDNEESIDFSDYGLNFDYVPAETFANQERGYFRYQLSCGDPADEFRFYVGLDHRPYQIEPKVWSQVRSKVEYWFLDRGDRARKILTGEDLSLMKEIFNFFDEIGIAQDEFDKANS